MTVAFTWFWKKIKRMWNRIPKKEREKEKKLGFGSKISNKKEVNIILEKCQKQMP